MALIYGKAIPVAVLQTTNLELRRRLQKNFKFDLSEAINTNRTDLSDSKILHLLNKREMDVKRGAESRIDDNLLQNLGIIFKFDGEFKPTRVAILSCTRSSARAKSLRKIFSMMCSLCW